jgi:small subunit ribosomal protein S16
LIKKYGTNGTHLEARDAALERLGKRKEYTPAPPEPAKKKEEPKAEEPAAEENPVEETATEEAAATQEETASE